MKLTGKAAIVTGAGNGIGQAIAKYLAREGADIAVVDLDLAGAEKTAEQIREMGRKSIAVKTNVADPKDVDAMVDSVLSRLGRVDILINDAGIPAEDSPTIESSIEHWQKVVDVSLKGTFLCSRRVGRWMVENKTGSIVNFASIAGVGGGFPSVSSYGSAKAGIEHMTRALAVEWGKYNIRVNCILPGFIFTTKMQELARTSAMDTGKLAKRAPLGRLGQVDDIAKVVLFLVSDEAGYITGVSLPVDGGWLAYGYI